MDKKDIYEHLAKIYLDASSKKVKKRRAYPKIFKNLLLVSILLIIASSAILFIAFPKNKPFNSEIALVLLSDAAKMNFNFDPAKEEVYYINLNELDLVRFRVLKFLVRKANYEDNIILKLEFTNASKEKSEAYFYNIPSYKWQQYKINLSDFKDISDWSKMSSLAFIIEESNVNKKKGIVYLDNVRFLR